MMAADTGGDSLAGIGLSIGSTMGCGSQTGGQVPTSVGAKWWKVLDVE